MHLIWPNPSRRRGNALAAYREQGRSDGRHLMLTRRLVVSTLALGFLVWAPTAANAQTKMLMSGKHLMYCCDDPPIAVFNQPLAGHPKASGPGFAKIYNT